MRPALRDELLKLPRDERARLAAELLVSLEEAEDDGTSDVESVWDAELERRVEDVEAGRVELASWDEVRADLRARLTRR